MPSEAASAITRLTAVWLERRFALAAALRSAVSCGVSARPSSATIGRPWSSVAAGVTMSASPRSRACRRRTGRVEPRLRADQPLLAAAGERFAALPEGEGFLEGGGALLELGHDADELVARLLVAELGDLRGGGVGHGSSVPSPSDGGRPELPARDRAPAARRRPRHPPGCARSCRRRGGRRRSRARGCAAARARAGARPVR